MPTKTPHQVGGEAETPPHRSPGQHLQYPAKPHHTSLSQLVPATVGSPKSFQPVGPESPPPRHTPAIHARRLASAPRTHPGLDEEIGIRQSPLSGKIGSL